MCWVLILLSIQRKHVVSEWTGFTEVIWIIWIATISMLRYLRFIKGVVLEADILVSFFIISVLLLLSSFFVKVKLFRLQSLGSWIIMISLIPQWKRLLIWISRLWFQLLAISHTRSCLSYVLKSFHSPITATPLFLWWRPWIKPFFDSFITLYETLQFPFKLSVLSLKYS